MSIRVRVNGGIILIMKNISARFVGLYVYPGSGDNFDIDNDKCLCGFVYVPRGR